MVPHGRGRLQGLRAGNNTKPQGEHIELCMFTENPVTSREPPERIMARQTCRESLEHRRLRASAVIVLSLAAPCST